MKAFKYARSTENHDLFIYLFLTFAVYSFPHNLMDQEIFTYVNSTSEVPLGLNV